MSEFSKFSRQELESMIRVYEARIQDLEDGVVEHKAEMELRQWAFGRVQLVYSGEGRSTIDLTQEADNLLAWVTRKADKPKRPMQV